MEKSIAGQELGGAAKPLFIGSILIAASESLKQFR
jgi:hypothetical protein